MAENEVKKNIQGSFINNLENMNLYGKNYANILGGGGQLGIGYQPNKLDAATPLVFTPTVVVVLQTPTMWSETSKKGVMLKSIIETSPKAISGIDFNYTLDVAETPAGNDGQIQEVPLKTKRSAISPSFTFDEVQGNLIWDFFKNWLFDINDPDTNFAPEFTANNVNFTMSAYCMSMLVIQFDPTGDSNSIIDGTYVTNMFPKGTGDFGMEKTIATYKVMERSIEFAAILHHNNYTKELARTVANILNITKGNYRNLKTGITSVDTSLKAVGLSQQIENIAGKSPAIPKVQ